MDIAQANVKAVNDHEAQGILMVSVLDLEHLTRVMNALKSVEGVENVGHLGIM